MDLQLSEFPADLESVGTNAFYNCDSIISITFPEGFISIGASAFSSCENLTSVSLPDSLTSIAYGSFSGCINLQDINFPPLVTSYPQNVFRNCQSLTTIEFPEGVTTIGYTAFYGCTGLESVIFPATLELIIEYAFENTTSNWNALFKGDYYSTFTTNAFYNSSVDFFYYKNRTGWAGTFFETNGTGLNDNSSLPFKFSNNYYTEFPDHVELFEYGGGSLPETVNGKPLTSIFRYAFETNASPTSLTLPDTITSIDDYAFKSNSKIQNLTLPANLETIGIAAFQSCYNLKSLTFQNSIVSIGDEAFSSCNDLNEVVLPEGLLSLGDNVFENCRELTKVALPDSLNNLGSRTFYNCANLKDIRLPETLTTLPTSTFSGCSKLTEIALPDDLISIDNYAFFNTTALTQIYFPASLTYIGNRCFDGSGVTAAYFKGDSPSLYNTTAPYSFESTATTIYHFDGATGFDSPNWDGMAVVNLGTLSPSLDWLLSSNYLHNTDLENTTDTSGQPLIVSYALIPDGLPSNHAIISEPGFTERGVEWQIYGDRSDIAYNAYVSDDLLQWNLATVSAPDANGYRTITSNLGQDFRFIQIDVALQ